MQFSCFPFNVVVLTLLLMLGGFVSVGGSVALAVVNDHPGYIVLMFPFMAAATLGIIFGLRLKVAVTDEGLSINKGPVIPWADVYDVSTGLRLDAQPAGVQRYRYGVQEQVKMKYRSRGKAGQVTLDATERDYEEIRELILSKVKPAPKSRFDDL